MKVGLRKEDAFCRLTWRVGVNQIAAELKLILPASLIADSTRF